MSDLDTDDEEGGAEETGGRRFSGKTLVLYVGVPVLVLCLAGVGAYFFLAGGDSEEQEMAGATSSGEMTPPVFYELPEFLVNLDSPGSSTRYLKMRVSLELKNQESVQQIDGVMPRVLDGFQVFLRELRPEDIDGAAGMVVLKEELLKRINLVVQPTVVDDILFQEIVVQ